MIDAGHFGTEKHVPHDLKAYLDAEATKGSLARGAGRRGRGCFLAVKSGSKEGCDGAGANSAGAGSQGAFQALPETKRCVECARKNGSDIKGRRIDIGMDADTYKDLLGATRS